MRKTVFVVSCFAVLGCEARSVSLNTAAALDSAGDPRRHPGYIVDSALSMDEELRRFREGLGEPVVALEHGFASREELARTFLRAAAVRDTTKLQQLHISRLEFAHLYFPSSKFAKPPYELPPALVWFQLTSESDRGITKLMQRLTNSEPVFARVECKGEARVEEQNTFWEDCALYWRDRSGQHSAHLFGDIIERAGVMKLLSFANDL